MEPSKINNTHSKDENINEEDKVANKVNTVTLNDFSDGDSENEPKITYHPNSCYASRKITYSAKLNEHLAQDLLSYKIIIDDDEINENF
ncbi:21368_t:CDS:2, partial [Rhizophagus irregularis]